MTLTLDGAPAPAVDASSRRRTMPWTRPALWLLLAGTAVLYLWDLGASGWANDFYAASAQAGSMSWKAWLFASLDPGNAITVDKPPAAMWVMGLSMRLFGVNSWALLVPQALMGVGSVALLAAAVRRWFGPVAGLIAGAALALTPVAVLMFRFDNPDALLVLLMTAAAYTTVRSLDKGSWKWLAGTGVLLGFAFLTKMLQGFLVLPGFALAYLFCAPVSWLRRVRDLLVAGLALVVSGGWLVALVSIWPASSRPYIAGSTNNSLWQLAIGYNGLGRIFGGEGNRGGGGFGGGGGGGGFGGGNSMFGGSPGLGRMFGSSFGLEISWLLPAALVALAGLLALAARQLPVRASALIWGGWTVVTALTFSFMSGTVHPYYSIALAPGIAALVAIGLRVLWDLRGSVAARAFLAAMVLVTGVWDFVLLGRVSWAPGLRWVILVAGVAVAAALLVPLSRWGRAALAVAAAAVLPLGLGSATWGVTTAGTAHTGSTPTSGPSGVSTAGFGRGGFGGGFPGGDFRDGGRFRGNGDGNAGGTSGNGNGFPGGFPGNGGFPGTPNGNTGNGSGSAAGGNGSGTSGNGSAAGGSGSATNGNGSAAGGSGNGAAASGNGSPGGGTQGNPGGGFGGGPGGGGQADAALVTLLKSAGNVRWAAATNGSMEAAPLQLASGKSVMAIGGFTGSDPSPTLAEFQQYVSKGEIHYYVGGGRGGFGGGSGSQIEQWVASNYTATTVGSSTVYDLTKPKS
jgi:4-amino-4-deoxy-L-arabinose transferase-like glycosyltransferase